MFSSINSTTITSPINQPVAYCGGVNMVTACIKNSIYAAAGTNVTFQGLFNADCPVHGGRLYIASQSNYSIYLNGVFLNST